MSHRDRKERNGERENENRPGYEEGGKFRKNKIEYRERRRKRKREKNWK